MIQLHTKTEIIQIPLKSRVQYTKAIKILVSMKTIKDLVETATEKILKLNLHGTKIQCKTDKPSNSVKTTAI